MKYDYTGIEKKWQDRWEENHAFEAKNDYTLPKYLYFCLEKTTTDYIIKSKGAKVNYAEKNVLPL